MNHEQLIDSVARDMTASEPGADFRARVMTALPAARRRSWLRLAIPAGAMAALALASLFVATRRDPSSPVGPVEPVVTRRDPSSPIVTRRDPSSPVVTRRDLSSPDDLSWRARAVAPLPPITPIPIEPIQPLGLSIAPITVAPIVTEPLVVPVLDSRSGGRE